MSLKINESGAYERELDENWAAAYAKRLTDQEANERDQAITAAVGLEASAREEAIAEEEAARVASDNAIKDGTALEDKCIKTRHINPGNVTSGCIHDYDVTEVKLATDSVTTAKIKNLNVTAAKLATDSVTNSKLASDVFATVQETRWGDDTRKAVTPNGLKQGIGYIIPASVSRGDFGMDNIPCDSIDADVTSIFHNPVRDAGLREYSETPVQVGTWIDGTPVWRVVIDETVSDMDISIGSHNTLGNFTSSTFDVKFVLGGNAIITTDVACSISSLECILSSHGDFSWDKSQQTIHGYTHLVGYIEFVTPASNIITS